MPRRGTSRKCQACGHHLLPEQGSYGHSIGQTIGGADETGRRYVQVNCSDCDRMDNNRSERMHPRMTEEEALDLLTRP